MKLWQRYLFRQLLTTFSFLILCLFAVYVLLDLSVNGVRFLGRGNPAEPLYLLLYYFRSFSVHLELFIPLSFLLTTLKVLFDLTRHLELVALQTAGLSGKKLLSPFFALAAILSLVCYANSEWVAPHAMKSAKTFKASYSKHKKKTRREHLQCTLLKDGSELVYREYDEASNVLRDVFWIRSSNDFWHIKTLALSEPLPMGHSVDHLVRNVLLQKTESFATKTFSELPLAVAPKAFIPFESRPLSTLLREALYAADQAGIQTHLHYKLALPQLLFLIVLGLAPLAMQFSRRQPLFLILALSLFGFIACITLLDSLLILGENRVLSPWIAIWSPILGLLALSIPRFAKL